MAYKYHYTVTITTESPDRKIMPGAQLDQDRDEGFTREVMDYIWSFMKFDMGNNEGADGWTTTGLLYINDKLARAFKLSLFKQDRTFSRLCYRFETTGMKASDPFCWEILREGVWAE